MPVDWLISCIPLLLSCGLRGIIKNRKTPESPLCLKSLPHKESFHKPKDIFDSSVIGFNPKINALWIK